MDLQHSFSSESCRSSTVDYVEEMTLESPKKRQDVQEVMEKTAWKKTTRREEDAWRLEPEGETEMLDTRLFADKVEGIYVDLNGGTGAS